MTTLDELLTTATTPAASTAEVTTDRATGPRRAIVSVSREGRRGETAWVHTLDCGHTVGRKAKAASATMLCARCGAGESLAALADDTEPTVTPEPVVAPVAAAPEARVPMKGALLDAVAVARGGALADAEAALADVGVATPTITALADVAPIERPGGMMYHPRTVMAGQHVVGTDVDVLRRLRSAGVHAMLSGPPGTGKTALLEAAFASEDAGIYTVAGHADIEEGDFLGVWTQQPDGRYIWHDGPLVRAMREGAVFFADDATLIQPNVLSLLYPAMDGRGQVTVRANGGEVVTAAPGFFIVAAHNPNVVGALASEALMGRFLFTAKVDTDYGLAESLGVDKRVVAIAANLATQRNEGCLSWAPEMRELLAYRDLAALLGPEAAMANLVGKVPAEDTAEVSVVVSAVMGTVAPLALGERVGGVS